ncbi:MAG: hypothetical protein ACM3NW_07370 [Syntrophomonadaceae bacterium]
MTRRIGFGLLFLAALGMTMAGCASYKPIAVTTNPSAVSSCQRVSDVALRNDRSYDDPVKSLIEETRAKGANTLLYEPSKDGAEKRGIAYECSLPPAAEKPQP